DGSTRLTDSYDATSVRGAVTTDGSKIWLGGDNSGGVTTTGGTRYATRGSTISSPNLSQQLVGGSTPTPDNIRDINLVGGNLYNSSGSSSSVGKAVFQIGSGLPESGSQTLTKLTLDNQSVSSFFFVDADSTVSGVDTLYTASGTTIRKFNLVG